MAPWNSEHLPHYGTASQIVSAAFAQQGIETDYEFLPWSQALPQTSQGKYDASISWIRTKDRAREFHYSTPIFSANTYWFYLPSNSSAPFDWENLGKHQGLMVGATKGYRYGQEFDALKQRPLVTVVIANTDTENFERLFKGEIDLFPSNLCTGYYLLRSYFRERIKTISYSPTPLMITDFYLLTSKKSPAGLEVLKQFNLGMEILHKQDSFRKGKKRCFSGWASKNPLSRRAQ
ncbi:substrate-binding periplasmic protein [Dongshaea marina]|uniref:substrate-binding periplasmic protein n=1 Tax=Dongshaea marina TaxID=2047966 RepID=UPI000D3E2BC2|nr:transporter substrate-binding domain-containing protein [Dongshaea marina]